MSHESKIECQQCKFDNDCHYRHYEYPECYNLREEKDVVEYYGTHSSLDYPFPDLADAKTDEEVDKETS